MSGTFDKGTPEFFFQLTRKRRHMIFTRCQLAARLHEKGRSAFSYSKHSAGRVQYQCRHNRDLVGIDALENPGITLSSNKIQEFD